LLLFPVCHSPPYSISFTIGIDVGFKKCLWSQYVLHLMHTVWKRGIKLMIKQNLAKQKAW